MRCDVPFGRLQKCPQLPMTAARDQLHPTISKTRNRFVLNRARGFESHHLRQQKAPAQAGAFLFLQPFKSMCQWLQFKIFSSVSANLTSCSFVRFGLPLGCFPARRSFVVSLKNRLQRKWTALIILIVANRLNRCYNENVEKTPWIG